MKERQCTLMESFEAYKPFERFRNTQLHPDEYLKVLKSITYSISETSLYKCLECFQLTSKETLDYIEFVEAVELAINPNAKVLGKLRHFIKEDAIYEYLAEQCEIYFPIGSLLKDHDYKGKNKIETHHLEKILRRGAPEMTPGDIAYFLERLDEGNGLADSKELLANINYYIYDRDKRQKLESRIPEKLIRPLDETEK